MTVYTHRMYGSFVAVIISMILANPRGAATSACDFTSGVVSTEERCSAAIEII
jgi:hypothetical protein